MFKAARINVQSYGLELVGNVWKYECDYVRVDAIALVKGCDAPNPRKVGAVGTTKF